MDISKIFAYESGELEPAEVVPLFQWLLDSGVVFQLQGSYQRQAQHFLDAGLITRSPKRAAKRGKKAPPGCTNWLVV